MHQLSPQVTPNHPILQKLGKKWWSSGTSTFHAISTTGQEVDICTVSLSMQKRRWFFLYRTVNTRRLFLGQCIHQRYMKVVPLSCPIVCFLMNETHETVRILYIQYGSKFYVSVFEKTICIHKGRFNSLTSFVCAQLFKGGKCLWGVACLHEWAFYDALKTGAL